MGKAHCRYTANDVEPGDGTGRLIWTDSIATPSMGVPTLHTILEIPQVVVDQRELPAARLAVTRVEDKRFPPLGERVVKIYSAPCGGPMAAAAIVPDARGEQIYIDATADIADPTILHREPGNRDRRINPGDLIDFAGVGFREYSCELVIYDVDGSFVQRQVYVTG